MNFLESLLQKRTQLKSTETVVTQTDGRQFKETKDAAIEIEGNTSRYGFVVDEDPDDIPAKIIDYVYLGSQDCCDEEVLKKYNLKHVLSVGIDVAVKHPDVRYKFVPCLDVPETDLEGSLRECVPFIKLAESEHSNILVHCNAGVSRSASVVIGYLILVKGYSYIVAYDIVKNARNCIKPNSGFDIQLRFLSNRCRFFNVNFLNL